MNMKDTKQMRILSKNEKAKYDARVTDCIAIVFAACYSGTAIYGTDEHPDWNLQGDNRIIISSSNRNELSWTEWEPIINKAQHFAFLHSWHYLLPLEGKEIWYYGFLLTMGSIDNPFDAHYAYCSGYVAATHNGIKYVSEQTSHPQIYNGYLARYTYW